MKMIGPVIPHNVDFAGIGIASGHSCQAFPNPGHGHTVEIPGQDFTFNRIQEAYYPHASIGAMTIPHLGLATPHKGPQPSLAGLPVESGLIFKQQYYLSRAISGFLEGLLQSPLFSLYRGSGL